MTDAYTTTASVDLAQAAYDRIAYWALRPELYYDQLADIRPTDQSMPGASVTFTIMNDLAIASSPLNESTDVTAVALSDSQVTATLAEFGNAAISTAKLRGESFVDFDPLMANAMGFNAGVSVDEVAKNILQAGTNVDYSTVGGNVPAGRSTINAGNIIASSLFRMENARLRSNNVPNFGGFYASVIHPNVAYDLRSESGDVGWRDPHVYSQPGEIWSGELGAYEGFRFIESPRAPVFATGGSGSIPVYGTLCMGRQGAGKVWSIVDGNGPVPQIVMSPVVDKLRRFVGTGWYWLGNYFIFRQAAIRRIESSSSLSYSDPSIDQ